MTEIGQALPKRREDLRITDQLSSGEKVFIVVDEESGAYYRLREVEFIIFSSLDGMTSLEEIKTKVESTVPDIEIPLEFLKIFLEDLRKKQLLEGTQRKKIKQPALKSLFYLRVASFNPDKMLDKLVSSLSFLFEPTVVFWGLVLICWSLGFSFAHHGEWVDNFKALLHGWNLLLLYFSFVVTAFVHETGHSLTCRYYGGRVREMGFLLIYFQPAFYSNVTDSYVFKEKRHRMYVGLAGLYFQFVFCAFMTIIWYFSIPGTFISHFCVGVMGMSGFTAFWNLNPLIKLDGYYVLNDYLETANLRASSFKYFGLQFQKWLFGFPETQEKLKAIPARLRHMYFWYGALGIGYTSFIIGFIVFFLVTFVAKKLATAGLLLIAGGIAWAGWKWYSNVVPGAANFIQKVRDNPELQVILKGRGKKLGLIIGCLIILGLFPTRWGIKGPCVVRPAVQRVLAPLESGVISKIYNKEGDEIQKGAIFASLDDFDLRQDLEHLKIQQSFEKNQLASLTAEYGNMLTSAKGKFAEARIAVQAHELLSADTISVARARYLKAETSYLRLHRDLLNLKAGTPPPEIAQIQDEVNDAEARYTLAESEWKRYREVAKQGLLSSKEIEEKKSSYESALGQFESLKNKLALAKQNLYQDERTAYQEYQASLKAYEEVNKRITDIDPQKLQEDVQNSRRSFYFALNQSAQIKAAEDKLAEVEAGIRTDEEKLARMTIRSPIDGIIMTPHVKELEGKIVEKGQPVAWVYERGPMIFEISVDELDVPEIPQGDPQSTVAVKLLALPGQSFDGVIRRVVPSGLANKTMASGSPTYIVDVEIDQGTEKLYPGMQGTSKIYGKYHLLMWQLVRRPVKYIFWKLWGLF